jgi:hypothetical protein
MTDEEEWEDSDESIEKTLANPNHPIYKVMLALCALLTVLWTQNGSI